MKIDLDAYFDKVYKTIISKEEGEANKKIAVLENQIAAVRHALGEKVQDALSDRISALLDNEVITLEDAREIAKKYDVTLRKKPKADTSSTDSCGHSVSSANRGC